MTNTNDVRILELKKQIEVKKEKLGKASRFTPITNCVIEFEGVRHNIQVLDKEQLISLMVKLNALLISAKALEVAEQYLISGYSPSDWIEDIKSKYDSKCKKEEEKNLKLMEDKLVKLLSDGKKTELEIDQIANLLN